MLRDLRAEIHLNLPQNRPAGFCTPDYRLCAGKIFGESKSFKLFMGSFRNHGAFHEDCTIEIAKRLIACMEPRWLGIGGYWYPRGGIPIDVFPDRQPPADLYIPDQDVAPYTGR